LLDSSSSVKEEIQSEIESRDHELNELEKLPRKDRDKTRISQLTAEMDRLEAQLGHDSIATDILASVGYEMWYFGVLLYQLCTVDGKTLWNVDQADNIEPGEMQDLAFRWSDLKASKLSKVVWPEARELIEWLLSEDANERPTKWAEVLEHRFLTGAVVIEGIREIADGVVRADQKLDIIIAEQKLQGGRMEELARAQEDVAGKVDETVLMLHEQSN